MKKYSFAFFLALYFFVRIFSFYFPPSSSANSLVSLLIILVSSYLIFKKNTFGWIIIAAEMFLGGSGSYFKIFETSVRTILLGISIIIYFLQDIRLVIKSIIKNFEVFLIFLLGFFGLGVGLLNGNLPSYTISDAVPYFFTFYFFPLQKLLGNNDFKYYSKKIIEAAVAGSAIFILHTFFGFSKGFYILQDSYYHWFRDIAGGKITYVTFKYYRLVLNEHLLLGPLIIYYLSKSIFKNKYLILTYAALFGILATNITRIYFVGIALGSLVLLFLNDKKNILINLISGAIIFITIFSGIFLYASGGKSFGLEIFGLRLQSIVMPTIEDSSLSRMMLLPKVFEKILKHPVIGDGFGSTVDVYSPIFGKTIITRNFDWGYFEMMAELGMVGLVIWSFFIYKIFTKIKKSLVAISMLISLLVINLTSPALFHVFGIIFLITLYAMPNEEEACA